MDSPQSVMLPLESSPFVAELEGMNSDFFGGGSGCLLRETEFQSKEEQACDLESIIGVLHVYIYQARDIHNICIYQKQDVYAKLCLTNDAQNTVSTHIINGGGKNPVFNQNLQLNVKTIESSLKCEIWMLSRVKNYLEDQLLGVALVPLSEVLMKNGKLENDFSLSSTDMFYSPAGFVHLRLSYTGASPEIMAIPAFPTPTHTSDFGHDSQPPKSPCDDFDKIEFPDPKILNENQMMVSEYLKIPCTDMDSQSSENLVTSNIENKLALRTSAQVVQSFSSSISTNGSPSAASSQSACDSKSPTQEHVSPLKAKSADLGVGEKSDSSCEVLSNTFAKKPVVSVNNVEPEQNMVQQDIVDMYNKSMQQFTDSLAKMKLPLDVENGSPNSGNSSTDQNSQTPRNSGSRVFYGSRAFF